MTEDDPPTPDTVYGLVAALGVTAQTGAELAALRFAAFPTTRVDQPRLDALAHDAERLRREVTLTAAAGLGRGEATLVGRLSRETEAVVQRTVAASDLLDVLRVEAATQQSLDQCAVLRQAAGHLSRAFTRLPTEDAIQDLVAVRACGQPAQDVLRDALAALFEHDDIAPRTILQWKAIFTELAAAVRSCIDATWIAGDLVRLHT